MKISRKCFLVSTAEDLNSSQIKLNQHDDKRNAEYLSSSTVTCANSLKSTIKKALNLKEEECFLIEENDCVRSCPLDSFVPLLEPFVTRAR